jgi:DNA-binding CsgD family transcriptional regulator/tetratricopeptide (TPR) repeat protein
VGRAVASQREAAACWRDAGDVDAEGRTRSELAHYLFWAGQAEQAVATASEAIAQLESIPPGPNLAHAYARMAQLMLITGRYPEAVDLGGAAVALALRWDGEADIVHALNTVGAAEVALGREEGFEKLQESLRRALAADLEDDISRAFNNLIAGAVQNRRFDLLDRFAADAVAFATERDLDMTRHCLVGDIAEAALRRGRWDDAAVQASATIEGGWRSGRFQSLAVLGLLTARRGEPEPFRWLDEALDSADTGLDDSALRPLRVQRAEAAWLAGDLTLAAAEIERARANLGPHENVWMTGEVAYWSWKLDFTDDLPSPVAEPYALLFAGHPQKAAAVWAAVGCPYDEALALAESDNESDLRRSLQLLQGLGAAPAAAMVTTKLRARGARRISRGPRAPTRANPWGLSNREIDVLVLIADGLRNAEIAERLDVSPKTVDHHVSSILRKVGARDRHEAARMAAVPGLKR